MKTKLILAFFALAVVAQLWVPASMIMSSEKTLEKGRAFKFRTAPVDPYDAFRGKYVALDFSVERSPAVIKYLAGMANGEKVYALITEDDSGFAMVSAVRKNRPEQGYYVRAEARSWFGGTPRLQFPFSKFFLEEGQAEIAERLYRQQNRTGKQDSYATVS